MPLVPGRTRQTAMSRKSLAVAALLIGFTGLAGNASAQSGPLLQPGEPYPGTQPEPIELHPPSQLHMPLHKSSMRVAPKSEAADTSVANESESAPQIDLIHPPRHKHAVPAQVANTAPSAPETIPFSLDGINKAIGPVPNAQPALAKGKSPSSVGGARLASADASGEHASMTKRGAILFEKGAPAPSPAQYKGVKELADALNNALAKGASAIQLEAYGGSPGDKSSDARRLSLRRALAVRQLLIDDGVPSARIDVRAMGGADDTGPSDRVDVFVRAG